MIILPLNETRSIKHHKLDNGMNVITIYDKNTKTSAAAMSVKVGHNNNPENIDGLAHYLEHMLFMGSRKYPKENYFFDKLSSSGGSTNAFTSDIMTVYFFETFNEFFEDAFDIWAHFFIDPLFNKAYLKKEASNVNEEYNLRREDGFLKLIHVLKKIVNQKNSYSRFTVGSYESLVLSPAKKKMNMYRELKDFFNKYYQPQFMNLVIYTNKSNIIDIVKSKFKKLKNNSKRIPPPPPLFLDKKIYNVNIKNSSKKNYTYIILPITINNNFYDTINSVEILVNIIEFYGKNSIIDILKYKKKYILDLSIDYDMNTMEDIFIYIKFELTDLGVNNISELYNIYIDFLQNIYKIKKTKLVELIEEYKIIYKNTFLYKISYDSLKTVQKLSQNMILYPVKNIFTYAYLDNSRANVIDNFYRITKFNNIIVIKYVHFLKNGQIETHFKTKFNFESKNIIRSSKRLDTTLLQKKNKYIPKIKNLVFKSSFSYPKILYKDASYEVWKCTSNTYNQPYFFMSIIVQTNLENNSIKNFLYQVLYKEYLEFYLDKHLYYFAEAGYKVQIKMKYNYLYLTLSGIEYNIKKILIKVLYTIYNLYYNEETFITLLRNLKKRINDEMIIPPHEQLIQEYKSVVNRNYFSSKKKFFTISKLNFNEFKNIYKKNMSEYKLQFFIQNKASSAESREFFSMIINFLKNKLPIKKKIIPKKTNLFKKRQSLSNKKIVVTSSNNINDINKALLYSFYFESVNYKTKFILYLIKNYINEKFFNTIRTELTYGYIAKVIILDIKMPSINTDFINEKFNCSLAFVVQTTKSTKKLLLDIEKFIHDNLSTPISESSFKKYLRKLYLGVDVPYDNFKDECYSNFYEILNHSYIFERKEKKKELLNQIKYSDYVRVLKEVKNTPNIIIKIKP